MTFSGPRYTHGSKMAYSPKSTVKENAAVRTVVHQGTGQICETSGMIHFCTAGRYCCLYSSPHCRSDFGHTPRPAPGSSYYRGPLRAAGVNLPVQAKLPRTCLNEILLCASAFVTKRQRFFFPVILLPAFGWRRPPPRPKTQNTQNAQTLTRGLFGWCVSWSLCLEIGKALLFGHI